MKIFGIFIYVFILLFNLTIFNYYKYTKNELNTSKIQNCEINNVNLLNFTCNFQEENLFDVKSCNLNSSKINTENCYNYKFEKTKSCNGTNLKASTISNKKTYYARILDQNVYLYSSPNDSYDSRMFIIEPSYFVKLIDDANDLFYKVEYMDLIGYVKKQEVQPTEYSPYKPYLSNIKFRVYLSLSQNIYELPNMNSKTIVSLPEFYKNCTYYGKIVGQTAVLERSNCWYYCKYSGSQNYYGYVYSEGCDQINKIEKNIEECEYIDYVDFSNTINYSITKTNTNKFKLIVIAVCFPTIIFVFMILKSGLILKLNKKEKAKETSLFFDSQ